MDRSKVCGCKGIRTCLICEKEFNLTPTIDSLNLKVSYITKLWFFAIISLKILSRHKPKNN